MEEVISSTCSISSLLSPTSGNVTALQKKLNFILQSRPECWLYSIFWQPAKDGNDVPILAWGEGVFRDVNSFMQKPEKDKRMCDSDLDIDGFTMWFYMVSMGHSFTISSDNVLGRVFCSGAYVWLAENEDPGLWHGGRVQEARSQGIQTLAFISTSAGVLELGSPHKIKEDLGLVQLAKLTFGSLVKMANHGSHVPVLNSKMVQETLKKWNLDQNEPIRGKMEGNEAKESFPKSVSCDFDAHVKKDPDSLQSHETVVKTESLDLGQDIYVPFQAKRGRKRVLDSSVDHVASERERRERLNRWFCTLRSVVPHVTKMDKTSLLADAVTYIKELRAKIEDLETRLREKDEDKKTIIGFSNSCVVDQSWNSTASSSHGTMKGTEVEVKFVGIKCMIRVQCPDVNFPVARLMDALRDLKVHVSHISASALNELVVQDVVVTVPDGFNREDVIRACLLHRLQS